MNVAPAGLVWKVLVLTQGQAGEKPAIGEEKRTSGANARCGEAAQSIFHRLWPD
jgi:hypothetical protein